MDKSPVELTFSKPLAVDAKDVEVLKAIGSGTFGVVKICRHKSGQYIAMKQLNKEHIIKNKQVDHLKDELHILASINTQFAVQFFGYSQNEEHFCIYMEMVQGGELYHYLREKGKLSWSQSCFYAGQIVLLFEYLHARCVVYRDLKPENLLINTDGYLKLTDFGFAKVLKPGHKTYTVCGTPEYLAPEIIRNSGHDKGADWWTLGVLLYEFLAGVAPFAGDSATEIYQNILKKNLKFPSSFSSEAKSLINKLLELDTTKRYGCLKEGTLD